MINRGDIADKIIALLVRYFVHFHCACMHECMCILASVCVHSICVCVWVCLHASVCVYEFNTSIMIQMYT